jgi:hypothetical protein
MLLPEVTTNVRQKCRLRADGGVAYARVDPVFAVAHPQEVHNLRLADVLKIHRFVVVFTGPFFFALFEQTDQC